MIFREEFALKFRGDLSIFIEDFLFTRIKGSTFLVFVDVLLVKDVFFKITAH